MEMVTFLFLVVGKPLTLSVTIIISSSLLNVKDDVLIKVWGKFVELYTKHTRLGFI